MTRKLLLAALVAAVAIPAGAANAATGRMTLPIYVDYGPTCAGKPTLKCYKPLANARVRVVTAGGKYLFTKVTDARGRTSVTFPKAGEYRLVVTHGPINGVAVKAKTYDIYAPFLRKASDPPFRFTFCLRGC